MQVHKVAHKEAVSVYMDNNSSKGKKNKDYSQSKSGLSFGMSKAKDTIEVVSSTSTEFHRIRNSTEMKAGQAFDAFGTQFLTPICFGILPLFPKKVLMYKPMLESEKDFVARLITLEVQSKSSNIINAYPSHEFSSSGNNTFDAPSDNVHESIGISLSASFQSTGSEDSGSHWFRKMSQKNKSKSKSKKLLQLLPLLQQLCPLLP